MDYSLPDSSAQGILQARILAWVAISFSRGLSWTRDQTQVSCITDRFFTVWATREALQWGIWLQLWWAKWNVSLSEVSQSCLTLCNPMDYSLPGSPIHGIFQAIVLKWVAISSSRGSSLPRESNQGLPYYRQMLYHLSHQGSPPLIVSVPPLHIKRRKLLTNIPGIVL